MPRLMILLLLTLLLTAPAAAQSPQPQRDGYQIPPAALSPDAELSIITVYPGDQVHAWFGHTAIRLNDPQLGIDVIYNYGVFDFDSPLFILTFARGHLDYILAVHDFPAALDQYRAKERAVFEQVLNLTDEQTRDIVAFLEHNALPENRAYRYRFLDDNCSTRVRDVFEHVLGERISFAAAPEPEATYRQALAPYLADRPAMNGLINLALARPADEPMNARQAMFLPLPLREAFDVATIQRDGEPVPLVQQTRWLFSTDASQRIERTQVIAPPRFDWVAAVLWGLLVLGAGRAAWRFYRDEPVQLTRRSRWTLDAMLFMAAGLLGTVALVLWTLTAHEVTGPNWNLLWAWPTHLLAGAALLGWPGSRVLAVYFALAAALTLAVALAWPFWPQHLPWVALPMALLLAVRAAWLSYESQRAPQHATSHALDQSESPKSR